jgi:hypothetical protein
MKPLDTLAVTDLASEVNLGRPPAPDLGLLMPSLRQRLEFGEFVIGGRSPLTALDLRDAAVRQPRSRHRGIARWRVASRVTAGRVPCHWEHSLSFRIPVESGSDR